jgi:hypothetical protein
MSTIEIMPTAGAASPTPLDHPARSTVHLRSLSKTSSTPVIDIASHEPKPYKFEGQGIDFEDDS